MTIEEAHNQETMDKIDETAYGVGGLMNTEKCMLIYNLSIVKKIAKNFPCKSNLLEFGAGIGTLATLLKTSEGLKPKCLEIDPNFKRVSG